MKLKVYNHLLMKFYSKVNRLIIQSGDESYKKSFTPVLTRSEKCGGLSWLNDMA